VLALYGVTLLFGIFGVILGMLAIEQVVRLRLIYAAAIVAFGGIGAVALKSALRNRWQAQSAGVAATSAASSTPVAQLEQAKTTRTPTSEQKAQSA